MMYYFQPFMSHVASMPKKGEIFEFFLTKCYVNFFFIVQQKGDAIPNRYVNMFRHHFLAEYVRRNDDLSDNEVNRKLMGKVFDAKESEKIIGDYDLYLELLRSFNCSPWKEAVSK